MAQSAQPARTRSDNDVLVLYTDDVTVILSLEPCDDIDVQADTDSDRAIKRSCCSHFHYKPFLSHRVLESWHRLLIILIMAARIVSLLQRLRHYSLSLPTLLNRASVVVSKALLTSSASIQKSLHRGYFSIGIEAPHQKRLK